MVALITGHVFYILPNTLQGTTIMTAIKSSGEKKYLHCGGILFFHKEKKKKDIFALLKNSEKHTAI